MNAFEGEQGTQKLLNNIFKNMCSQSSCPIRLLDEFLIKIFEKDQCTSYFSVTFNKFNFFKDIVSSILAITSKTDFLQNTSLTPHIFCHKKDK